MEQKGDTMLITDTRCSEKLYKPGELIVTCEVCGLGPCPFMHEPVADIDAKLRGLNVARAEKFGANAGGHSAHRDALRDLANAADAVGVRYFDSDDLPPLVQKMQEATQAARVVLGA